MSKTISLVLYLVLMVAVIVGVDLLFFKNRFLERLLTNVGIVLLFGIIYFLLLRKQ